MKQIQLDLDKISTWANEYLSKMREALPELADGKNSLLFVCMDNAFKEGVFTCIQEINKQSK